jgi:cytoskeletal protein RodZ
MSSKDPNSHTNSEIGLSLEQARTERGLSLWQVEEATKIRARYLRDLERENFDVLPAVYVLGFLKTYADFLGLDGEALSWQLKNRRASLQEEVDPADEELTNVERGGLLTALGGLPVTRDRNALDEDEDVAVPVTVTGQNPRLYLGLGAVLILVLAVALTTMLGGTEQPAVSQVREPAITDPPSRLAFSGNVGDPKGDERNADTDGKNARSEQQPESSNDKKEEDQARESEKDDEEDAKPDEAEDLAINSPSPSTASASTASVSASSTAAASATSMPIATADASSAASVPASGAPDATAPHIANPGLMPRPAVDQPRPGTAGAPAGARRVVVVADGAGPVERIVGKVRFVRVR